MRFRHPDGSTLHLGYCSNVHAEASPSGIGERVAMVGQEVRARLGTSRLGVGLWLPAAAAASLRQDVPGLDALRQRLGRAGLEVVTLNGFPYGDFHAPVVKHAVYRPDWSTSDRLRSTVDQAHILAALLPDDIAVGSISTLPLGWREWMDAGGRRQAAEMLGRLGEELERLHDRTGRRIQVGLEPEPGCVLSTAVEVADWVHELDHPAIGVSLDACHLAVEFEDPHEVAARLRDLDSNVVKLQVANALRSPGPTRADHRRRLERYVEPRFLHQTRVKTPTGVDGTDDLDEALTGPLEDQAEWRVHVHVPVHHGDGTTQRVLTEVLDETIGAPRALTHHLEVETYTWTVLPPDLRPTSDTGLAVALAAELDWTRDQLLARSCREVLP